MPDQPDFSKGASGPNEIYDTSPSGLGLSPAYLSSSSASATGGGATVAGTAVQKNGAAVATEASLDFEDGTEVKWTVTDDNPNTRVKVTPTIAAGAIAASKITSYPTDATKFLNGNGAWTAPTFTYAPATFYGSYDSYQPSDIDNPTEKMTGFASVQSVTITPLISGKVVFNCVWTSGGGATTYQWRYGTGAAPGNGAAATGTAIGTKQTTFLSGPTTFVLSGLTVGVAYWFDLALASSSPAAPRFHCITIVEH